MHITVTGAAGYIGSTLTQRLNEAHHTVTAIDNQAIGDYKWLKAKNIPNLQVGDIRNPQHLDKALKGTDAIAHLAALPGLVQCNTHPDEATSINILGTHQLLEAAKRNNVKRVIFCSTAAVYGTPKKIPVTEDQPLNPLNLYGITKLAGEKLMDANWLNDHLETVCLRFGNVYGVGLYTRWTTVIPKFVKLGLEGKPLTVYGDGTSSRDFVHVEDICQALELALTTPDIGGEKYNVGSEPTTIGNIAKTVADEVEKTTREKPKIINQPPRLGEIKEFEYDLTKIRTQLKYKPKWTIKKGVTQLVNYHKQNNPN